MKKLLFTVLICLLFIPFVFAENLVEIESIELIDFSDTAKEKTEPTHEGLEMNYDVSFGEVDDFVKYKIVVKNNSDVDYKISEKELFNESHYVKYTYEVGELLKAKSSVEVYLTISYNKEIDEIDFTNGVYEETNKAIVKLLDENNEEVNPNTKSSAIMFIIFGIAILLFLASVFMLLKEKRSRYVGFMMIFGIIVIPFVVKAIEELILQANVKVEVKNYYTVKYNYRRSMALRENELEDNGYTLGECTIFYNGTETEENKYYNCSEDVTYTDPKKYTYGERIEVMKFPVSWVYTEGCVQHQPRGNSYYYVCPADTFQIVNGYADEWWNFWPSEYYNHGSLIESLARSEYETLEIKDENGNLIDYEDFYGLLGGYTLNMPSRNLSLEVPGK